MPPVPPLALTSPHGLGVTTPPHVPQADGRKRAVGAALPACLPACLAAWLAACLRGARASAMIVGAGWT